MSLEDFDLRTVQRGKEIPMEVYEYFFDVLPPIRLHSGQGWFAGYQMGEPQRYCFDGRAGMARPVYHTFTCCGDRAFYQGVNFAGEVDSTPYMHELP